METSLACYIIDDEISISLLASYILMIPQLKLVGSSPDTISAINDITALETKPDFVFVNVDKNTLNWSNFLNYVNCFCSLVFLSDLLENAYYAFENNAVDYLLKPITYERFNKFFTRYKTITANRSTVSVMKKHFYIQSENKGRLLRINLSDIHYVEACLNYITIYFSDGKQMAYITMKELEQRLPDHAFIRVHKSYLVNEEQVHLVSKDYIVLKNKTLIKIGPNYRDKLFKKLNIDMLTTKRSLSRASNL